MKKLFYLLLVLPISVFCQSLTEDEIAKTLQNIKTLDSIIKFEPTAENYYYRGYFSYLVNDNEQAFPTLIRQLK